MDPHGGAVRHRGGETAECVKNSPHGVPWGLSIFLWRERPFSGSFSQEKAVRSRSRFPSISET